MKIRILTDYLFDYKKGQILDLAQFVGTPMEEFFRTRLREADGICEIVAEKISAEEEDN